MTARTCPSCGHVAGSNFCPECGADVRAPGTCAACGADLAPGARFCTECGRGVEASGGSKASASAGWVMVAAAILLIGIGGWMLLGSPGSGDRNEGTAEAVAADARAVDLASMTPLEAADRLYIRIMERMARGDTAQARAFLPMASAAYDRVPVEDRNPLVRYRVGVLHQMEGRPEASSAQADTILASYPSHLLGLFLAGESAQMLGDGDAATRHYARFLEVFPSEIDDPRPEYRTHLEGLTAMRQHAESYLSRGAR